MPLTEVHVIVTIMGFVALSLELFRFLQTNGATLTVNHITPVTRKLMGFNEAQLIQTQRN